MLDTHSRYSRYIMWSCYKNWTAIRSCTFVQCSSDTLSAFNLLYMSTTPASHSQHWQLQVISWNSFIHYFFLLFYQLPNINHKCQTNVQHNFGTVFCFLFMNGRDKHLLRKKWQENTSHLDAILRKFGIILARTRCNNDTFWNKTSVPSW